MRGLWARRGGAGAAGAAGPGEDAAAAFVLPLRRRWLSKSSWRLTGLLT